MKRRARNGFTLLEMLLAISLIAMIVVSLVGGLRLGTRAWEAAKASESLDEVEGAARAIANQIARAFPASTISASGPGGGPGSLGQGSNGPGSSGADAAPAIAFVGAVDGCRFVALSEGGAQWGGLILTEIAGENTPNGGADIAIWTRVFRVNDGLAPGRGAMTHTTVLRNVAGFELAYFGALDKNRLGWTSSWRNRPGMPTLVSVKLGANRLGRVIEASAVVALRQQ